jgi:hypothetical protein
VTTHRHSESLVNSIPSSLAKQRAEYATRHAAGPIDASQLIQLSFVEPDSTAFRAFVDAHVLRVLLVQVGAAAGAFVVVSLTLRRLPLRIQFHPHLVDNLEILFGEIFVFVPARLFIRRHVVLVLLLLDYTRESADGSPCRIQGETLAKKISRLSGSVPNVFPTPVQVIPAELASETIPL